MKDKEDDKQAKDEEETTEPPPPVEGDRGGRLWAITTTSIAGVSTVGAVVSGILYSGANSRYQKIRNNPGDRTREEFQSELESAASSGNLYLSLTIGTGALAVATGGAATFLWVRGGGGSPESASTTQSMDRAGLDLDLELGFGSIGVSGRF